MKLKVHFLSLSGIGTGRINHKSYFIPEYNNLLNVNRKYPITISPICSMSVGKLAIICHVSSVIQADTWHNWNTSNYMFTVHKLPIRQRPMRNFNKIIRLMWWLCSILRLNTPLTFWCVSCQLRTKSIILSSVFIKKTQLSGTFLDRFNCLKAAEPLQ